MNIKKIKLDNDVAHRNISRYHVIMRFTSIFTTDEHVPTISTLVIGIDSE